VLDLGLAIKKFETIADTVNREEPLNTPNAHVIDNMTMEDWVRKQVWTKSATDMFRVANQCIWGASAAQLSLLQGLWHKGCSQLHCAQWN
jgi:monoamine oxidase